MRMRRKKNLSSRLEDCRDYVIMSVTGEHFHLEEDKRYNFIDTNALFNNDNPIEMEIGCGKGGFLIEKAIKNPNINFIGVEVCENVIVSAGELAKEKGLKNVKFLNMGAELLNYFIKDGKISNLYLNFSCPYPKKQYENHRLTYKYYLEIYKKLLKKDAKIYLKTDNDGFFEYSKNSFLENGFELLYVTDDLYSEDISDNIQTEYERKFVLNNFKIHKLIARQK
jgi:tRNA (guanine-N7-)-methyltransferase